MEDFNGFGSELNWLNGLTTLSRPTDEKLLQNKNLNLINTFVTYIWKTKLLFHIQHFVLLYQMKL